VIPVVLLTAKILILAVVLNQLNRWVQKAE
jgi:hypothetical protein